MAENVPTPNPPNLLPNGQWLTQSRQSTKLSLQSSEFGLPRPFTRECLPLPPLVPGVGHTLACERGGGVPNSNDGTDTVVL
jgi:hypothetical protein